MQLLIQFSVKRFFCLDFQHENFFQHLSTNNPAYRGLFFVEGIDTSPNVDTPNPNPYGCFWGENLMGVERHPIRTGQL